MQKNNWKKCKLKDLSVLITRGITPKYSSTSGMFVLNQKCIRNGKISYTEARLHDNVIKKVNSGKCLQQGDTLVCSTGVGTLGRVGRFVENIPGVSTVDSHVTIVRPCEDIFPLFLSYAMINRQTDIEALAEGTTGQTELSRTKLEELVLDVPPLYEQKQIAEILGAFDDKIELLQKQNKTLEEMAKAVFKSWFVDFDVVKAKAALEKRKRFPTETLGNDSLLTKADIMREYHLTEELYDLFPSSFEDSPLGPIPSGWEVGKLANVAHILGGFAFKSKDFTVSGVPVIKIKNIQFNHSVNLEDVQYVNEDTSKKVEKFALSDGDIVMAMTGATIGKFAIIVNKTGTRSLLNQRVAKISAKQDLCHWFVYFALLLNDIEEQVKNNGLGSAQPNISTEGIGNGRIIEPNPSLQNKFALHIKSYMDKILYNKKQIQTLTELRDSLLPRLISGKIRV